jgi:hypothetical protein
MSDNRFMRGGMKTRHLIVCTIWACDPRHRYASNQVGHGHLAGRPLRWPYANGPKSRLTELGYLKRRREDSRQSMVCKMEDYAGLWRVAEHIL